MNQTRGQRSQIMRCFSSNCKRPPHYISEMSKLPIVMHKSFWWEHVFKSFHLIAGSVSSLKVLMNLCEFSHTSRGHFKFWKYHNLKVLFRKDKKNFCRKGKLLHKRIFCRILNVKTCLTLGKMCLNVWGLLVIQTLDTLDSSIWGEIQSCKSSI